MKLIDISTPKNPETFSMVDDEDFDWLNQWRWFAHAKKSGIYAARRVKKDGKSIRIYMHREILKPSSELMVDHRDRNGLNNQRLNLRYAGRSQNARNCYRWKNTKSGLIGVQWDRNRSKWRAHLEYKDEQGRHRLYLGSFVNPIEAAKRRDEAAEKYHGEFALLNFPK